ncbi:MacB family efflux pump subunit [Rhizobium sp. ZPR3]|uniref:Pyoverdine export ATP-binding/permease protein PvdT n=2 Tax=unclassified Rhizobium TaxID=2613769 RepID=A0AAU7SRX9_9HYPH
MRYFVLGNETVQALKGIDLVIEQGEFVALVGASGSGKSTLMNILGCLDEPTDGLYRLAGQDTSCIDRNGLAELRRRHFGFVFQRYHLLASMSALENAEVPAIYDGVSKPERRERARQLLGQLGLEDRLNHRPTEMSGGQQQRVSVARALMNGGEIILADEPTGALDSKSGAALMDLLKSLHSNGHTIILVTHDMSVAQNADRIIEINDGLIVSSQGKCARDRNAGRNAFNEAKKTGYVTGLLRRLSEASMIAMGSIVAHRLRSALTLFGIIVGIVAVITVVGLGEGGQRVVLDQINSLGVNSISVLPGTGWDDQNARMVDTLIPEDAAALAKQPYVNSVSPLAQDTGQLIFEDRIADGMINGVSNEYFTATRRPVSEGTFFTAREDNNIRQEAIIDHNARKAFFGDTKSPLGQILVVKGVPYVIVGAIGELSGALGHDKRPQVYIPYESMFSRISGSQRLSEVVVRLNENFDAEIAEQAIIAFLEKRHATRDFFTSNSEQLRQMFQTTTRTLSILISSIAGVALIIGGVGVMNIMLVSVTERTVEIGIRMAVGARASDIMMQFLIEALAITVLGGSVAVLLAVGLGVLASHISLPIPIVISVEAIVVGCSTAMVIGAVFGFFPARKAARLKPVEALAGS